MTLLLLSVFALLTTGLLAGVHLAGAAGLNPALRTLDGPTYLAVKSALDREFPQLARPLMLASLSAGTAVLVGGLVAGDAVVTTAAAVATVALVGTLVAILRGDLPINRQMASWSNDGLPADWQHHRARWERFFTVRMATTSIAVVALAVALVAAG